VILNTGLVLFHTKPSEKSEGRIQVQRIYTTECWQTKIHHQNIKKTRE